MDDGFIATATYVESKGFELWIESGEVTHWMPLPEPPIQREVDTDGKHLQKLSLV